MDRGQGGGGRNPSASQGDKCVIYAFYIETNLKHRLELILRT